MNISANNLHDKSFIINNATKFSKRKAKFQFSSPLIILSMHWGQIFTSNLKLRFNENKYRDYDVIHVRGHNLG